MSRSNHILRRPGVLLIAGTVLAGVLVAALVLGDGDERAGTSPSAKSSPAPPQGEPDDRTVVLPAVVHVRADSRGGGGSRRSGSGFVIDDGGHVVTSAQVVSGARRIVVRFGREPITADLLGRDASVDIALLKIDPADVDGRLRPLELGSSAGVRRGDRVVALAGPQRGGNARTGGAVSAIERMISPNGFLIAGAIVADIPLGPSDAGSPLLDDADRVVGVNSLMLARPDGDAAVAIPVDEVKRAVEALQRGERVERAYLGARLDDAPAGGVAVVGVLPGGPAASAGLRRGDLLVRFDDKRVRRPDDVVAAVNARRPGDDVDAIVERDGARRTLAVVLGTRPEQAARR